MKEVLRKIASVSLALIVLFSTMSFSVDMHYCGDHLVDFSMFGKVDACAMEADISKTSSSCEIMEMEKGKSCCSDVEITIQGQDNLKISLDQLTLSQQQFVFSFTYSFIHRFEGENENIILFRDYVPPPLIRDVQILDQTFLI